MPEIKRGRRRALLRRLECAVEPARLDRFRRILSQRIVDLLAFAAFEPAQIGTGRSGLDADQHHAKLALGAARPLDRHKRRFRERELRHMTLHVSAGSATPWSR